MPLVSIQNLTSGNFAVPPPVGKILGPNQAVSVRLSISDLESQALLALQLSGKILFTPTNDPGTPDALEGGVLSVVASSSSAAATSAADSATSAADAAVSAADAASSASDADDSAVAAAASEAAAASTLANAELKTAVRDISFSVAAEAGDARVASMLVKDGAGTTVTATTEVYVEVIAPTAGKGFITVTNGTSNVVVNDVAGNIQRAWITTTSGGAFAVSIADDQAETVLLRAIGDNGAVSHVAVAFT